MMGNVDTGQISVSESTPVGEPRNNQDQILCVNVGEYLILGSVVGSCYNISLSSKKG